MQNYKTFIDEGIYNIKLGRYQLACELISKSINLKSDWEISYFYRAVAYHALNDTDNAILDYTKAIKLNPNMIDAYYNRAKIMLETKDKDVDIDYVINDLSKALELDNNFIDALFAMACAQKKKKNYSLSLEYLNRLLKIEPEAIQAKALKKLLLQKYINKNS